MNIGETIKIERTKRKISQAKLGEILQITQQAVGKWEKGLAEPDSKMIVQLADLFGCTTDYLLGREERKDLIKRPAYDITDQKLVDFMKLYEVMTEIQKAQVLGYVIGLLENAGVHVKTILGY